MSGIHHSSMSYCVLENRLYTCISNSILRILKILFVLLTDVPKIVSVSDKMYYLQHSGQFAGDLFMSINKIPYYSLENALNNMDSQLNYRHCLLIFVPKTCTQVTTHSSKLTKTCGVAQYSLDPQGHAGGKISKML